MLQKAASDSQMGSLLSLRSTEGRETSHCGDFAVARVPVLLSPACSELSPAADHHLAERARSDPGLTSAGRQWKTRTDVEFPVRSRRCVRAGWRLSMSSLRWRSSAATALAEMPVSQSQRLCKRPGLFSVRHHRSYPPNQQNPSKCLHFSRRDTQLELVCLCGMSPLS